MHFPILFFTIKTQLAVALCMHHVYLWRWAQLCPLLLFAESSTFCRLQKGALLPWIKAKNSFNLKLSYLITFPQTTINVYHRPIRGSRQRLSSYTVSWGWATPCPLYGHGRGCSITGWPYLLKTGGGAAGAGGRAYPACSRPISWILWRRACRISSDMSTRPETSSYNFVSLAKTFGKLG